MVKILQEKGNKTLRQKAVAVPVKEIASAKTGKIIADLKKVLATQDDGVAIAAPQIGVPKRIIVISGKVKAILKNENEMESKYPDEVFINPVIKKTSREKQIVEEGCLSVRWLYGKVKRSLKVNVEYHDERGRKNSRGASGLLAQIFQHEVDHLEGVLFTDKATDVHEWAPEKELKNVKK